MATPDISAHAQIKLTAFVTLVLLLTPSSTNGTFGPKTKALHDDPTHWPFSMCHSEDIPFYLYVVLLLQGSNGCWYVSVQHSLHNTASDCVHHTLAQLSVQSCSNWWKLVFVVGNSRYMVVTRVTLFDGIFKTDNTVSLGKHLAYRIRVWWI